jgi:hypothetical protein
VRCADGLDARAKRKDAAREDYEGGLERGKTAVLHEEVLRGVHMLSVGHVAPGAEIEVQSSLAVALSNLNGRGTLRIPLTVGDIYGRSGLPDSDDLAHGGTLPLAEALVFLIVERQGSDHDQPRNRGLIPRLAQVSSMANFSCTQPDPRS